MTAQALPQDERRCIGYRHFGVLATPCRDCRRQTETQHGPRTPWMRPPPVINNICPDRLVPAGENLTDWSAA